jgi:hypothetical protein
MKKITLFIFLLSNFIGMHAIVNIKNDTGKTIEINYEYIEPKYRGGIGTDLVTIPKRETQPLFVSSANRWINLHELKGHFKIKAVGLFAKEYSIPVDTLQKQIGECKNFLIIISEKDRGYEAHVICPEKREKAEEGWEIL